MTCLCATVEGRAADATSKVADDVAVARLKLDTEQAAFNREVEHEKIAVERMNAWITGVSLMVPLMVAALTFALGVWNQNQQARLQREAQAATERAQFELKAAEIVMNESGPVGSRNKARALKALFPNKLAEDFVSSFKPEEFLAPEEAESSEARRIFFQVAASRIPDVGTLGLLWQQLFPEDHWPDRLTGVPPDRQRPAARPAPPRGSENDARGA